MKNFYVVTVAALSQFIQQLIANITVVALPQMYVDLNFSPDTILWVNLIYLTTIVAFCLPFSKVINKYGVKKWTFISMFFLLLSIIITVFSINRNMLLISRLIQGITSAILASSIYIMIVNELDENSVGSALGITGSAGYIGMLIAPSLMGFIMEVSDWRLAFLILIPIITLILFLLKKIKTEWHGEKNSLDKTGSLMYIVGMILFTYSVANLDDYGIIPFIISLIILFLFVQYERKIENPLYKLNLLKDIKYNIGNYAAFATYFSTTVAITALSFHLQYILNTEEYLVGLILIVSPILMIGVTGFAGRLSNKHDPRIISGIALIFIFIAMILFVFIDQLDINLILLACAFQGLGNGLFSAPNNKYVLTLVNKEDLHDASSILSTSKEFGRILSSGIYTLLLSVLFTNATLGDNQYNHLLIYATNNMMAINAVVVLIAAILLFYCKFKYDNVENPEIIEFFKSLTPDWIKKRMK